MIVKILPNDSGEPPNKLADVELLFEEGVLSGLRLIGFAIWQRGRGKSRSVTVPSRTYFVLGERRAYALLRPITNEDKVDAVRRVILEAYAEFERRIAGPDIAAGDADSGGLLAGGLLAGGLLTGDVTPGEVSAGDVSVGDVSAGDVSGGDVAAADATAADAATADQATADLAAADLAAADLVADVVAVAT